MADMHQAAGRYPAAIAQYQSALDRGLNGHAGVHYRLGFALLKDGRPEAAEASLHRALDLAPEREWPYGRLVECLLAQDRLDDAAPLLTRGLELHPDSEWLQAHLISLTGRWRRRGNRAAARALAMAVQPFVGDRIELLEPTHPTRVGKARQRIDDQIAAALAAAPGDDRPAKGLHSYLYWPELATPERAEALEQIVARYPRCEEAKILSALLLEGLGHYGASTARLKEAAVLRWGQKAIEARSTEASKPDFLIIGQAKAGTTALYQHLCDHPGFRPPLIKEPLYWSMCHEAGPEWYAAQLPPRAPDSGATTGEATPDYFPSPLAPQRIAAALPGIRLILVLRDSVERAYSHYWMDVRSGRQSIPWEHQVETALNAWPRFPLEERELLRGGPLNNFFLDSAAVIHLRRWLNHFPPQQLLILHHSDLLRQPQASLDRVCGFLGLPAIRVEARRRVNEGFYPPMPADVEQRLRAWFAPHDRELERLLADLNAGPMTACR